MSRRLLGGAICLYMLWSIADALRTRRVPHRLYLLERDRRRDFATQGANPLEYWAMIVVWCGFALAGMWLALV